MLARTAPGQALQTQDFGQLEVNSGTAVTLNFSFTGLSSTPLFTIAYGVDFSLGTPSCTLAATTLCTLPVNFAPLHPGVRQDAVLAKSQSGALLETAFLRGIGLGPQLAIYPGIISSYAGNGTWGYVNAAPSTSAQFRFPQGIAMDPLGNLYVADSLNQVIRKIAAGGGAVSTLAGSGVAGYDGDGGPAQSAQLNTPTGVALDAAGNVYIADQGNNVVRRIDAATNVIATIAGGGVSASGSDGFGDGGPATSAILDGPNDVAVDPRGNLYIADSFHELVRVVYLSNGSIDVVAGGGSGGGTDGLGDGGAATGAQLSNPVGLALDAAGNLYIADSSDCLVRMVNAASGVISVVAGSRSSGYSGDGGLAINAKLASPAGVRVDAAGNIYIADFGNNVIRQVQAASGKIVTIAGSGANGYSGDGGVASAAELANPTNLVLDSNGNLYIADYVNNVVREVAFAPPSLIFPSTSVGAFSPNQTIVPSNIGNQDLSFTGLSLSADFQQQLSVSGACTSTVTLAAGSNCNLAISFVPSSAGSFTGTAALTDNSLNMPGNGQTINLSGVGTGSSATAPQAVLSPSSLDLGIAAVAVSGSPQLITLSNPGGTAFSLTAISLTGQNPADFILSSNCGSTLAAGASCTVSVTFTPVAAGVRIATLDFADTVTGSPQTVSITGTGLQGSASLNANSLSFSQNMGTTSGLQTVTFSNNGALAVSIFSIFLTGSDAAEFSLSTNCGAALAAGSSCQASLSFSANTLGAATASLVITDTAAGSPHVVTISGNGVPGLLFVPATPCRIADTRHADGPFGGPILAAKSIRSFIPSNSACGIPPAAQAFSLNVTVVPSGGLGYLSIWPTGQSQPLVSLLNSDGRVKANAAIVPAGAGGAISLFVTDETQVIIDINGYFIPPGSSSALGFYPLTPCRIADTRRQGEGSPVLSAGEARSFPVVATSCNVPSSAQAFSLNFTVVPPGPLGYLSVWPAGQSKPLVSTLNVTVAGNVTANAAIVPAGTDGQIAVYASDETDVVIDINGYFAPVDTGALSLYTVAPCRAFDSRKVTGAAPVDGALAIAISSAANCSIPSVAEAFALNATVIPQGGLGFLTLWPDGATRPVVSTLNADDGAVTSNLAIVPSANGSVDAYTSGSSQLVLDVAAYFAP